MKNAPKDATHYGKTVVGNICFYKLEGDTWYYMHTDPASRWLGWRKVWDNIPSYTPLIEIKHHFTKADLLDGMRVEYRNGNNLIYIKERLYYYHESKSNLDFSSNISDYNDDLAWDGLNKEWDIMKVTDRDGTVLFEREQPKKKVTLELTDEQIAQVKAQFML